MKRVILFTLLLGIATLVVAAILSFQHPVEMVKVTDDAVVGVELEVK